MKKLLFLFGLILGFVLAMLICIYQFKVTNIEKTEFGEFIEARIFFIKNCYYYEY